MERTSNKIHFFAEARPNNRARPIVSQMKSSNSKVYMIILIADRFIDVPGSNNNNNNMANNEIITCSGAVSGIMLTYVSIHI